MITFNNTNIKRKTPIKRNNKFFSGEDYDLEMEFATEYMEQDANQTIILYQVDLEKTKINDTYKEATKNNIKFKTPIELTAIYEIQEGDLKAYSQSNNKGLYVKPGKLIFSVLLKELEENKCDINRGDFIGIQITETDRVYFTVTNDGKVNTISNKNTIYGKKPYYRTCEAAPIDIDEFQG